MHAISKAAERDACSFSTEGPNIQLSQCIPHIARVRKGHPRQAAWDPRRCPLSCHTCCELLGKARSMYHQHKRLPDSQCALAWRIRLVPTPAQHATDHCRLLTTRAPAEPWLQWSAVAIIVYHRCPGIGKSGVQSSLMPSGSETSVKRWIRLLKEHRSNLPTPT